jgi:hypothetical protein
MPDDIHRITIQISDAEMKKLKLWARWHGKPKASYAGQIVSARIEANVDTINRLIADEARTRGISAEELEKQWLQESDD